MREISICLPVNFWHVSCLQFIEALLLRNSGICVRRKHVREAQAPSQRTEANWTLLNSEFVLVYAPYGEGENRFQIRVSLRAQGFPLLLKFRNGAVNRRMKRTGKIKRNRFPKILMTSEAWNTSLKKVFEKGISSSSFILREIEIFKRKNKYSS